MFTGIIEGLGELKKTEKQGDNVHFTFSCPFTRELKIDQSVAHNGICLTVIDRGTDQTTYFDVEISSESLSKTNSKSWKIGSMLNLERSLRLGDELGGHIVSGHVDGVAKVLTIKEIGDSTKIEFDVPEPLAKFCASKGSVSLNGTSLTINDVLKCKCSVNLIPHTKSETIWRFVKDKAENSWVNSSHYQVLLCGTHPLT